jgi:hypothetical protein
MKRQSFVIALHLATAVITGTALFASGAVAQSPQQLVGHWMMTIDDHTFRATYYIELHPDGTYLKIMRSSMAGIGGTHYGTWRSSGPYVYLSGDGHWPPTTEDLRNYQRTQ